MSALDSSLVDAQGTRFLLARITVSLLGVQRPLITAPLHDTD